MGQEYPVLRCAFSPAGRFPSTCFVRIRPNCSDCCIPYVCLHSSITDRMARLSSRCAPPFVTGQEVCTDWGVVGILAFHDEDHARVVSVEDRGNVVDFLFRRDPS